MTIVVAIMLVVIIALSGICFYLLDLTDKMRQQVQLHSEWQSTATDLFGTLSNQQDKNTFRLNFDEDRLAVAEERILNLQNRTGQIQIKLKKMDSNTIYEVKDGE